MLPPGTDALIDLAFREDIGDGEGRMFAHVAEVDIYISFDV